MMRRFRRWLRRAGLGLVVLVLAGLAARQWLVTPLIERVISGYYDGKVTVRSWWLGGSSSGLVGVELHETKAGGSRVWAGFGSIKTDISLSRILQGKLQPAEVAIDAPVVDIHLHEDGSLATKMPFKSSKSSKAVKLPRIVVSHAALTLAQAGRPPLVVKELFAQAKPAEDGGIALDANTLDPYWAKAKALGKTDASFVSGEFTLKASQLETNREKTRSLPFVPPIVWKSVDPTGPADIELVMTWGAAVKPKPTGKPAFDVRVTADFLGTHLDVPILGFETDEVHGRLIYDDKIVTLENARGRAFAGALGVAGEMSFASSPSRFDLDVTLADAALPTFPKLWATQPLGLTGRLDAAAKLKLALSDGLINLVGTELYGVVLDADLQGIPIDSIRVIAAADGEHSRSIWPRLADRTPESKARALRAQVAADRGEPAQPERVKLPKVVSEASGRYFDIPRSLAEKLAVGPSRLVLAIDPSMAAIPTPKGHNWRALKFEGELASDRARIEDTHLGNIAARFSFDRGVAEALHFGGVFIDPPGREPIVAAPAGGFEAPIQGELPDNAFRGKVRVDLAQDQEITFALETRNVPLGGIAARLAPSLKPLSARVTLDLDAKAPLGKLADPSLWDVSGMIKSPRVAYDRVEATALETKVGMHNGRLDLTAIRFQLGAEPVNAALSLSATEPYAFALDLKAGGSLRDIGDLAGLVSAAPYSGDVTIDAKAKGTLKPLAFDTAGSGKIAAPAYGRDRFGDLPFAWKTENGMVSLEAREGNAFGGELEAKAAIPAAWDEHPPGIPKSIRGTLALKGVDLGLASRRLISGDARLKGKASGSFAFDASDFTSLATLRARADATLTGDGLTIDRVDVKELKVRAEVKDRIARVEAYTETLGGTLALNGEQVIAHDPDDPDPSNPNRLSLKARNLSINRLATDLEAIGVRSQFQGLGDLDLVVKLPDTEREPISASGQARFRDLRFGARMILGDIIGNLSAAHDGFVLGPITGDILGGAITGSLSAKANPKPPQRMNMRFDLELNDINLKSAAAAAPALASRLQGVGSARLSGTFDQALEGTLELFVPRATVSGLPLQGLHASATLDYSPAGRLGAVHVTKFNTKFAGGQVSGRSLFRVGENSTFQTDLTLNMVDLELLTHSANEGGKPAKGKISGQARLEGPSLARRDKMRGKITLDLDDGSLFALPVLSSIAGFLGVSRTGVFEDGDLSATIANNRLSIDELTLEGRLMQLLARGNLEFDGRINLAVVINTNELIALPAQVLRAVVPIGRGGISSALSNQLIKLRVTGTIDSPSVAPDPTIEIDDAASTFFLSRLSSRR